jgi:hypothetical protein
MKYKLSFKASADVDRKIEVNFQQSVDPWGSYATKEFDITTTEQEYTFVFDMEEDSDDAAQFAFNLGQTTGAVKISDVKLVFTTGETQAIASTLRLNAAGKTCQVFDMQGRNLGKVDVANGASVADALFAKFQKAGVYMVKQGNKFTQVRVTR